MYQELTLGLKKGFSAFLAVSTKGPSRLSLENLPVLGPFDWHLCQQRAQKTLVPRPQSRHSLRHSLGKGLALDPIPKSIPSKNQFISQLCDTECPRKALGGFLKKTCQFWAPFFNTCFDKELEKRPSHGVFELFVDMVTKKGPTTGRFSNWVIPRSFLEPLGRS